MKNIYKYLVPVLLTALCFSCAQNDDIEFVSQQVLEPVIVSPNSSLNLAEESQDVTAFTLVWDHAEYDVNTPVNYRVEIDKVGNEFQDPNVVTTKERFYSWTVGELNTIALEKGLTGDIEGGLEVQVKSFIGNDDSRATASDVFFLSITPFVPTSTGFDTGLYLYFVGNATAAGWNNDNNNTPLFRNENTETQYTFTGRIKGGDGEAFKFLELKGQWAPQWGNNDGVFTARPTEADPDPGTYDVAADGYYTVNIDLSTPSYAIEAFDVSGATDYEFISLMGDSFNSKDENGNDIPDGWEEGALLERSDFDSHIWFIKGISLNDGGGKFRANKAWEQSWGGAFPSTNTPNDANIPVKKGVYDVWFNDLTNNYSFIAVP